MLSPEYDTNLHAATTVFWNALHADGDAPLSDLLSPDCQYIGKSEGIECFGCEECMERLTELRVGVVEFEKSCSKLRIGVKVNRKKKTSRFLVTPLSKSFEFSLGMFLLWECGIIIGIKVVEDAPKDFLESSKLGKANAKLSQAQNNIMRSRTGKSHYKWRQVARVTPTGVVVEREQLAHFARNGDDTGTSTCDNGGTAKTAATDIDGDAISSSTVTAVNSEEIYVPLVVDFHQDDTVPLHTAGGLHRHSVEEGAPPVLTAPTDTVTDVAELTSGECDNARPRRSSEGSITAPESRQKRLRFDRTIHAALIHERCELPPDGVFYTSQDIHKFTQDFANEIREVAYAHNVSYKEAIDIYYCRTKGSAFQSTASGSSATQSSGEYTLQRSDTLGWYPAITGKYVDQWREGDGYSAPAARSIVEGTDSNGKKSGWYLGKYIERVTADDEDDKDSWYLGKYVQRLKKDVNDPSRRKSNLQKPDGRDTADDIPVEGRLRAVSIESEEAPKLVLNVKVIGCRNLRSPLKRLLTRPINAVVDVCVGDELRSTEVVHSNPHPLFRETNTFLFGVPMDGVCDGFIEFTVSHKGLVTYDAIGVARVPFASLRTLPVSENLELRPDQCSHIILPLIFKEPHVAAIGKGFYERPVSRTSINSDIGPADTAIPVTTFSGEARSDIDTMSSLMKSSVNSSSSDSRSSSTPMTAMDEDQEQWYIENDLKNYIRTIARARFADEPGKKKSRKIPTLYVQVSKHLVD